LLGGEGRPQLPPVSLLLAVAVLSVCRVACRCCTTSATARLSTACHASPHLSFPTVLLLAGVDRPQLTPGSLLFAVTIAVLFICRVACRCCSSSATARLCTACHASPHLSFPAVLLLEGVARRQLPLVLLLLAVIIAVLSCCLQVLLVFSHRPSLYCLQCFATIVFLDCLVPCRCCPPSAAARLSVTIAVHLSVVLLAGVAPLSHHPCLYCLPPSLSSSSVLLLGEVLPVLSYRPSLCSSLSLLRVTHLYSPISNFIFLLMLPSPGGTYLQLLLSCC